MDIVQKIKHAFKFKKVFKTVKALSLLEVSFVLIIMSLMTFAVMKGFGLVRKTQANRLSSDVQVYIMAANHFKHEKGEFPGIYQDQTNAEQSGISMTNKFFTQLREGGLINVQKAENYPTPIGGYYIIVQDKDGLWIKICQDTNGENYYQINDAQWNVIKNNENLNTENEDDRHARFKVA